MKFEVIKRSHLKRNILIAILVVTLISSLILNFTQAKYRVTESMPLIQGTINFSPSDLNLMAVYLNKNGETISSDKVPHVGYTLNTEQSICEVNDEKDENIEIVYENGLLNFNGLGNKGTKCTAYFDLIPDSENPVINQMIARSLDDVSITITVNASDNLGVFYYYYRLDNGEEIRTEQNTYTFEGLTKNQTYIVSVRVEDAAGNSSISNSNNVTAGYSADRYILANEGGAEAIESKGTPDFQYGSITNEGMYAVEDDYGTSYYYRGAVDDNWVYFAGFYWRIIRINGDSSIRMIYSGSDATGPAIAGDNTQIGTSAFNTDYGDNMYVGYMYKQGEVHGLENSSTVKKYLDQWYEDNLKNYQDKIALDAGFCNDRIPYIRSGNYGDYQYTVGGGTGTALSFYGAYLRIIDQKSPSYKCSDNLDLFTVKESLKGNKSLNYPIGLITVDEILFAGESSGNTSYYLHTGKDYWTISPYYFATGTGFNQRAIIFTVWSHGSIIETGGVSSSAGVRPVINLRADVSLTGSGTTSDPFVVVS